jgi:hypothetical protein
MTDTRITVDVSTEALLQRARQQQAQSRQAVIQQEEEKREKARQQREAQKAGRGSVPGQSRLQGRSRAPQTGSKRREVAAGYVQQSDVASGHFSFRAIVDDSVPTTFTYESEHKLWTGNGSKFLEVSYPRNTFSGTAPSETGVIIQDPDDPPQPQSGSYTWVSTLPISVVLPAGGNKLIFVAAYSRATEVVSWSWVFSFAPQFGWFLVETVSLSEVTAPTRCYIVSKSNIRQVSTPAAVSNWIAGYGYKLVNNDYIYNPLPDGISQGLGSSIVGQGFYSGYVPINTGTPRTAETIANANASSWSPKWLQFSQPAANTNTSIPRRITQLTPSTHEPVDLSSGTPVRRLAIQASIPGQSSDPQIQATPLIAWDWDKPDLAKRFLSRIGFTPADLVP